MQDSFEFEYDVHEIKMRLVAYKEKEKDIDHQLERLDRLETRLMSIGSPTLSDMPKAPSASHDREADLIAQKIDLENEIKQYVQEQKKEREEINRILGKILSSDEKAVIRMRYIDMLSWNDVVDSMFGGKEDFLGKEDTYLRRTHKIHGAALVSMAKVIYEENNTPDSGGIQLK